MNRCKNIYCGKGISKFDNFCPYCGEKQRVDRIGNLLISASIICGLTSLFLLVIFGVPWLKPPLPLASSPTITSHRIASVTAFISPETTVSPTITITPVISSTRSETIIPTIPFTGTSSEDNYLTPTPTIIPTSHLLKSIIPVLENTQLPTNIEPISVDNANKMKAIARVGKGNVRDIAISPDDKYFVIATSIGLWMYQSSDYRNVWFSKSHMALSEVAFSEDGNQIIVGGAEGSVEYRDANSGEITSTLVEGIPINIGKTNMDILSSNYSGDLPVNPYHLSFSIKSNRFASTIGSEISIRSLSDGKLIQSIDGRKCENNYAYSIPSDVKLSNDGKYLLASFYFKACIWNVTSGEIENQYGGNGRIGSITVSNNFLYLTYPPYSHYMHIPSDGDQRFHSMPSTESGACRPLNPEYAGQ